MTAFEPLSPALRYNTPLHHEGLGGGGIRHKVKLLAVITSLELLGMLLSLLDEQGGIAAQGLNCGFPFLRASLGTVGANTSLGVRLS